MNTTHHGCFNRDGIRNTTHHGSYRHGRKQTASQGGNKLHKEETDCKKRKQTVQSKRKQTASQRGNRLNRQRGNRLYRQQLDSFTFGGQRSHVRCQLGFTMSVWLKQALEASTELEMFRTVPHSRSLRQVLVEFPTPTPTHPSYCPWGWRVNTHCS